MIKFFEFFLPLILLVGLLTPFAHAAININIDVSGIVNAVNGNTQSNANALTNNTNTLNTSLLDIPTSIMNIFFGTIKNALLSFNNTLMNLTKELLSANPDPAPLFSWWQTIITIISAFYLLIFLIIGFQFLLSGNNATKREQAKEWLKNVVIMIIAVNISFYLYQLALELSTAITQYLWEAGFEQFFQNTLYSATGIIFIFFSIIAIGLALITLFIRYLFLLAGVILFPIAIFLYLTPKLDAWGKMIFNFLGVMLVIQLLDIIILIATQQVMIQLAGNIGTALILPLGFTVIALTNTLAIIYAIIKSALTITTNAPIITTAINTVTGNLAGAIGSAKQTGAVN